MRKRKSTPEFIEDANDVHDNKYDYSLVVYNGALGKVKIICNSHGPFEQQANNHLFGQGCPTCKCENKILTAEEFISKARNKHADRYDYSLVNYIESKYKIKIICNDHGIFEQTANSHLHGKGCPKCSNQYSDCIYIWNAYADVYKIGICNFGRVSERIAEVAKAHGYTPTNIKYFKTNNARKIEAWLHKRYPIALVEKLDGYTEFRKIK